MNIIVNIDALAEKYPHANLTEFLHGHTYPLSELMEELGVLKGTPQGRPRANTK